VGETTLLILIRAGWSIDQCQQLIGVIGKTTAPITTDQPPITDQTDHRAPITTDHTDQPAISPPITTDRDQSSPAITHAQRLIADQPSISHKAIARSLVDHQLVGSISSGIRVARSVRRGTRT
jgi:hypothetical protein